MKLLIISGRSGSGKSSALNMLEDLGFYCVDNLPASLLPALALQSFKNESRTTSQSKVAVSIDARNNHDELSQFPIIFDNIPSDIDTSIIYLDADNNTLIKRFSETRRRHPLSSLSVSLSEAIIKEAELLDSIAQMADLIIETSKMTFHELREIISDRISDKPANEMSLLIQSFGYKSHIPVDSDFVFDVRCLPNPYWNKALRPFNGNDKEIIEYLGEDEDVVAMVDGIINYLTIWLPKFKQTNRSYTTISIGCTGGQHRSVFVANALHQHFKQQMDIIQIRHRELRKKNNA